jgi:hypothetical protein
MDRCKSIKSKKHPDLQCPHRSSKDGWCAVHQTSRVLWKIPHTSIALKIKSFIIRHMTRRISHAIGPAALFPELAHNDKDIYSYDSVSTIPLVYRFSYSDSKHHLWLFDIRFLLQLLTYGKDIHNPFTQESIPSPILEKLQKRSAFLVSKKIPIVYLETDELTPEQLWNQKVLDVFLKLTSLGYGVNVHWFEMMNVRAHELFYERLYELWTFRLHLSEEVKQSVIPGYDSGRSPLFKWGPDAIFSKDLDLKWWRKMNLSLMRTFISRSENRDQQSLGALYILTALAEMHPRVRAAFPWLVSP